MSVIIFAGITACHRVHEGGQKKLDFELELKTVQKGYNAEDSMWTQAYVGMIAGNPATLKVTMSKLGQGVDNYGNLYASTSEDLGSTWDSPKLIAQRSFTGEGGIEQALSDVFPSWHAKSEKLLATGKLFLYDSSNEEDPEIGRRAGYLVYNPENDRWGDVKILELPEFDHSGAPIINPTLGCIQRYDMANGDILLPMNYVRDELEGKEDNITTVLYCSFDGENLTYIKHGDEITIPSGRGLYEGSIAHYNDEYFLTLRANGSAYVTKSKDGLEFQPIKEWTFNDGTVLGSYNTQQHWVTHSEGLFLVYTRRGANNDNVMRHRAPLFIGQVDPENLSVHKETEKELMPNRGARLGNFGVANVNQDLTVVSAAERLSPNQVTAEFDNTVYVSKILWNQPNRLMKTQK
ncbi:sialidase family protein [Membranihabitans marinus]|uniref:sialidase family protein n=1 Tax=Membranihabitans marinus TaxID=1227546 RepID=UPI001F16C3B4|nr:sialidase family protein [Membranihabitans marinus]